MVHLRVTRVIIPTTEITKMPRGDNQKSNKPIVTVDGEVYEKQCIKCDEVKHVSEFNRDQSRKDGYQIMCKPCKRALVKPRDQQRFAKEKFITGYMLELLTENDMQGLKEMCLSIMKKARHGDLEAFDKIITRVEGKVTEKLEVSADKETKELLKNATEIKDKIRGITPVVEEAKPDEPTVH